MRFLNSTFFLRLAAASIFLSHSLHGIFINRDVNDFGNLFLNKIGFAPFGVPMAWAVVITQVATSLLLLTNKYIKFASLLNIVILVMGIVLVHYKEGWFVMGGGSNGMEFSVVLIFILLTLLFPEGVKRNFYRKTSYNGTHQSTGQNN